MSHFELEPLEPLLKALANPVRTQVLLILSDRSASAAEVAEILGEPVEKIRYHLRALAKSNLIGWEEAKDRRGVREYFWVVRTRQEFEDEQYASLTDEQIRQLAHFFLRLIFRDATTALRENAFARRTDHVLARFRTRTDEQGWKELITVYFAAMEKIKQVDREAARRLAESSEDPVTVSASLTLFDLEAPARPMPAVLPTQE